MALAFPYTYISCPCSDASRRVLTSKQSSHDIEIDEELEQEEKTFDPRHPRSAFSLFPPEHLLYCEECHDIKCPRCVTEEIICWYCPSCLFETPSSTVRSEVNRCARNCLNCPLCTSQLITAPVSESKDGPFILNCNYCMWSTLDIDITFDKPTSIRTQLDRIANGGKPKLPSKTDSVDLSRKSSLAKEPFSPTDIRPNPLESEGADQAAPLDANARFNALRTFYRDQITASSAPESGLPASALDLYSSPSSLARIMDLYSNIGTPAMKKSRQKPSVMREALTKAEGLEVADTVPPIKILDYIDAASIAQRHLQYPVSLGTPSARSVADLRPMPTLLRTKRSKRCATCKHILVKPESKLTSTRYRIKLIALNYLPFVTLKPVPIPGGLRPMGPDGGDVVLDPSKPSQWILTMKNPLYENVKVTLGAEGHTPGKWRHRVTILCPEFEIGKSGDVWDDALNSTLNKGNGSGEGGEQVAGKLYDQGKNWASVVIEIVAAIIEREEGEELEEDEDVIELPIRVRLEWKVNDEDMDGVTKRLGSEKLGDEGVDDGKREVAYWMVLGVGKVKT